MSSSSRREDTRDAMLIAMAKTLEAMADTFMYKQVYNLQEVRKVSRLIGLAGHLKGTREIFEQEAGKQ